MMLGYQQVQCLQQFNDTFFQVSLYSNESTLQFIIGWLSLTHWGRVTHICVGNLAVIGSDKGLSPVRRQAIIWTNAGILLIEPLRTNSLKY